MWRLKRSKRPPFEKAPNPQNPHTPTERGDRKHEPLKSTYPKNRLLLFMLSRKLLTANSNP